MCESKLALAIDCWTSLNHHACMSIVVSWLRKLKDGTEELTESLLDFFELPRLHSGFNMAEAVAKCLEEYGIEAKVSNVC